MVAKQKMMHAEPQFQGKRFLSTCIWRLASLEDEFFVKRFKFWKLGESPKKEICYFSKFSSAFIWINLFYKQSCKQY